MDDAASVEYERFQGVGPGGSGSRPAGDFNKYAAQLFFPAGKAWGKEMFGGVRAELLDRDFLPSGSLGGPVMQRYVLSAGVEVMKREDQRSFALASAGYNSDFRRLDWDGVGSEYIYAHLFQPGPRWQWGLGLDMMRYYDAWHPFPLLFLDWWFLDRSKARVNADVLELRQFLGTSLCLTLGLRYNLYYGALGREASFELETVGAEQGIEYRFGQYSLRLKAKQFVWGSDALGGRTGQGGISGSPEGGSLRMSVAFAP